MATVITKASEHVNAPPVTPYCTVADVRTVLHGVEMDDAGSTLGAWLSTAAANEIIEWYVSRSARSAFERMAKRDFEYHEEVDVVVDGDDSVTLRLDESGFLPLMDITAMTILDEVQSLDDFVWYQDGRVAVAETYNTTYLRPRLSMPFPYGRQNVALTISWGYETPPEMARVGTAYLAAAEVLRHIERSGTNSPGMVGGIQKVQYEDFQVTHYQRSRFGASIDYFKAEANKCAWNYHENAAISLKPSDAAASLSARENIFDRGRSDLG